MEVFESRYFVINKKTLESIGYWPYSSRWKKLIFRCLIFSILTAEFIPQVIGIIKDSDDQDRYFNHLLITAYLCGIATKLFVLIHSEKKFKKLFDHIAENWKSITDQNERNTLIEFSERGRIITIIYIVYMLSTGACIAFLPAIPTVLDIVNPLNESRTYTYIYNGNYLVENNDKHYWKIWAFEFTSTVSTLMVLITVDTTYAIYIEHSLGLFTILKFTEILKTAYSLPFLLMMSTVIGHLVMVLTMVYVNFENRFELVRYATFYIGGVIHIFFVSWPGQKIHDYSSNLFIEAYQNEWYKISMKSRRLLHYFMLRCLKPCYITAGEMFNLNLQNFATIVRTSASYFLVLKSTRV